MNTNKTMMALVAGLLSAGPAWATHGAYTKAEVSTLQEASVAVGENNPDLSSQLKEIASREQSNAAANVHETSAQEKADAKIIKEGSVALKVTRPDLSRKLDKLAAKELREPKRKWHHAITNPGE